MYSLIKKHMMVITTEPIAYLIIIALMAILYVGTLPPYFLFIIFLLAFILQSFYTNDKYAINRFVISLPVSRRLIVQSHYYYLLMVGVVILLVQFLLMLGVSMVINETHYVYHWKDFIILISFIVILISIINPIYYTSKSFIFTSASVLLGVFLGVFFLLDGLVDVLAMEEVIIFNDLDPGFSLLIEKYLPFQPYIILIIVSILLWFISMAYTEKTFHKKDC